MARLPIFINAPRPPMPTPCSYLYRPHTCYRPKNIEPCLPKDICFSNFDFLWQNQGKILLDFLAPSVLIRNSEMATWKRIVACSVGGAGCQSQSSPGIPCWFSCHGAVVGAPWPSVGASWQRWMRRRATGDPASPGLLTQEGEATLQNSCWRFYFPHKICLNE